MFITICLTPLACSTANPDNIDSTPFIFMVLFTESCKIYEYLTIITDIMTNYQNIQYFVVKKKHSQKRKQKYHKKSNLKIPRISNEHQNINHRICQKE